MTIEEVFDGFNMKPRPSHPGDYRGRCWFRENHQDGSGRKSMFISTERNSYHCFSCGESGNLISAMTIDFGVSVSDALDLVDVLPSDHEEGPRKNKELNLLLPIKRPDYYLSRGFSKRVLWYWAVGQEIDDRGRELIVVPFYLDKRLIAVQYLHVKRGGQKDIWGTEFDKSAYFYGLDFWRKESTEITLVEGITDTWRVHLWGLSVGGLLGTELTENHLPTLKKRLPNLETVYLAQDNDPAGFLSKEKSYYLLRHHYQVRFLIYPQKDPDACDEDSFLRSYEEAMDYAEYQLYMDSVLGGVYADIQEKAFKLARKKGIL